MNPRRDNGGMTLSRPAMSDEYCSIFIQSLPVPALSAHRIATAAGVFLPQKTDCIGRGKRLFGIQTLV
jgi:hypothetical protein